MSDYTPSTEEVRDEYIGKLWIEGEVKDYSDDARERIGAEFDRWLAEHDRQVAAKALEDLAWDGFEAYLVDPELEWENQPSTTAQHFKRSTEKLRRRASEYRKEEEDE